MYVTIQMNVHFVTGPIHHFMLVHVLQDIKTEDVILELRDGKDFDAIFILREKSFRVHLGMI